MIDRARRRDAARRAQGMLDLRRAVWGDAESLAADVERLRGGGDDEEDDA